MRQPTWSYDRFTHSQNTRYRGYLLVVDYSGSWAVRDRAGQSVAEGITDMGVSHAKTLCFACVKEQMQ